MIHEKIKQLRIESNLSQDELAHVIGISRPTLSQIELGERKLKADEVQKIASIFEISPSELLETPKHEVKTVHTKDAHTSLKNLVLYILGKCGQKPNVGEIVLNKLLYFCDFNAYELTFESISGTDYVKFARWPVPKDMDKVLAEMENEGKIKRFEADYYGYSQKKAIPLIEPDMMAFNGKQIEIIDKVINEYSDKNGKWLTDFSHEDMPWKATKNLGDQINYGLVFHRSSTYSVSTAQE